MQASPGGIANIAPSPGEISRRWAGEELAELVHKHNRESQEAYKIAHDRLVARVPSTTPPLTFRGLRCLFLLTYPSLLENKQKSKCEVSPYALDESGAFRAWGQW